jgi:hypothetical protein
MPDVNVIEYRLASGERGRIDVKAVSSVSVLSDGRGVIYLVAGELLVVLDGKNVCRQWSARTTR